MDFDYIVIGGGSAGCALASRLSEKPDNRVALIEAGGTHLSPFIQIPFMTMCTLPLTLKNWHFKTIPQPGLNNRRGYQPRGKVLGGSSGINAMIYIRGQAEDYDNWATQSSQCWSYENVLPIFKQFEANQQLSDDYHSQQGELSVTHNLHPNEASQAFVTAGTSLAYPHNEDFNGVSQYGVGLYQVTQRLGRRHSAADAYLSPIASRPNLTLFKKARALALLLQGKSCNGVRIHHQRTTHCLKARKEVILTAGAFGSPQLLLLSGIGPKEELKRHGIAMVHELPGVGQNLQDHPDYILSYASSHPALIGFTPSGLWDMMKAYRAYRRDKTGLMASNFAEAGGFLKTDPTITRPDIQLHFVPGIIDKHLQRIHFKRGISCHVCVLRPKSRGDLRLKSANPWHKPLINPNFLSEDDDVRVLLKGLKMTREILEQPALTPYRSKELFIRSLDDEHLIDLIRARTDTVYHPVGTCRMGLDEMAVVDPKLKVHGIDNLRVADASIMPDLISGNTNAPSMMIGEQAARFILEQS